MMRVITGSARGRRLSTLDGEDVTRPTTESVKEALFSMIQFEIADKEILDLFAGCGQLGIEALSRGASKCTFVEMNKNAYKIVRENIDRCKFADSSELVQSDAISFLNRTLENFDIAFLDPPYKMELVNKALPLLARRMNEDGIIVCETSRDEELPENVSGWTQTKVKNYGKTKLTLFRKEQ